MSRTTRLREITRIALPVVVAAVSTFGCAAERRPTPEEHACAEATEFERHAVAAVPVSRLRPDELNALGDRAHELLARRKNHPLVGLDHYASELAKAWSEGAASPPLIADVSAAMAARCAQLGIPAMPRFEPRRPSEPITATGTGVRFDGLIGPTSVRIGQLVVVRTTTTSNAGESDGFVNFGDEHSTTRTASDGSCNVEPDVRVIEVPAERVYLWRYFEAGEYTITARAWHRQCFGQPASTEAVVRVET